MSYTARQKSSLWLAMSVLAAVSGITGQRAFAYTYNWIGPTTGTANWNDAANWSSSDGGSGIPNGVGDTASFASATLTGGLTVNLNQAITIGNLNMSHGGGKNLVIGAGSGGSLIMDNTGTTSATLTSSLASGGTNYFSTNLSVQLNDNLVITANSGLYLEGGNFTGSGNISKIGSTTLNIGRYGTNTYTGTFTVNDNYVATYGDVLSGQAGALGNSTSPIYAFDANAGSSGIAAIFFNNVNDNSWTNPQTTTVSRDISAADSSAPATDQYLRLVGGTTTTRITGNILFGTSDASTAHSRNLWLYTSASNKLLDITGEINSTGNTQKLIVGLFNASYGGTVRLSNANSNYTTATYLEVGRLLLAGNVPTSTSANSVLGRSSVVYMGNGTNTAACAPTLSLLMDGSYTFGRQILVGYGANTATSSLVIGGNTAGTSQFTGNILQYNNGSSDRAARTLNIQAISGGRVDVSGNIGQQDSSDTLHVRKIGQGTVSLSGINTYKGTTTVRSGALEVNGDAALGSSATAINVGDATTKVTSVRLATLGSDWFNFNSGTNSITGAPTSMDGKTLVAGDRILVLNALNSSGAGAGYMNGIYQVGATTSTWTRVAELDSSAEAAYGTQVTVTEGKYNGGKTFFLANSSAVTLNTTAMTWTEDVVNPDAALLIDNAGGVISRNINIAANSSTGRTTLGANITSGVATYSGGVSLNRAAYLSSSAGGQVDFTGVINDANGGYGLTQIGGGTVNLTGANTFGGGYVVSDGLLKVNNTTGSATGSGNVLVAAGAALGGGGTIAGNVTVLGELAPGNSIGTITVGGLTISDGGKITIELGASGASDRIVINGDVNLASLADTLVFTGTPDSSAPYVIATYTGMLTGTFDYVINLPTGMTLSYANAGEITLQAVPETASLAVLAAGGLMLAGRRRK